MHDLMSERCKHITQSLFVPFALMGKVITLGPLVIWCWLIMISRPGLNWCVRLEVLCHYKSEIRKQSFGQWDWFYSMSPVWLISCRMEDYMITYLRRCNWLGQSSISAFGSCNLLISLEAILAIIVTDLFNWETVGLGV